MVRGGPDSCKPGGKLINGLGIRGRGSITPNDFAIVAESYV